MKKTALLFLLISCLLLTAGCSLAKPKPDASLDTVKEEISEALNALGDLQNEDPSETAAAVPETEYTEPAADIPADTVTPIPTQVPETAESEDEDDKIQEALIRIPDVEGRPADEAESILSALGLSVVKVEKESTSTEAGFVISQSPTPEKNAKIGDTVTLYVAKGSAKEEKKATPEPTPEPTKAPTEAPADSGKTYMYCAASDYLTLRDIASRSGRELARIPYNAKLEYLGMEGEFTFVSYQGQNGYVLTEFLSSSPDPDKNYSSGSKKKDPTPAVTSSTLYCCASEYATLRSEPSTSSDAITRIYSREAVSFISSTGSFYYVEYGGYTGYVLQKFFSFDPDAPLNYDER